MPSSNPKILLVEGDEDRRVIPFLMDEYVVWGNKKNEWVAEVESHDGIENLFKPGNIRAAAKTPAGRPSGSSSMRMTNSIPDGHESGSAASGSLTTSRRICLWEGLIHQNSDGLRIGVWIMPDNRSRGMLETFLSHLIVPADATLWAFAQESCTRSRDHGASYTDPHRDKANIHTYLAWRNPPGMQLHVSVFTRALDARLPLADRFAKWFIHLFQLTPR
jgi:hypothetical protein